VPSVNNVTLEQSISRKSLLRFIPPGESPSQGLLHTEAFRSGTRELRLTAELITIAGIWARASATPT
jgi:hypothetical protein